MNKTSPLVDITLEAVSDPPQAHKSSLDPVIIPRHRHNISRRNLDEDALRVLYRLHNKGYLAYLVGGSVRDLLLERPPKDFDIGTDAKPEEVRRIFRNSRIIGRRFKLVQVFFPGNKIIEVSTFRSLGNGDDEEAVLSSDNTYGTPAEDAWRRDLTINALFYNIADFSIVDYVGGMDDLQARLIRAVGDADVRFHQDPVRIMRALRHSARTGFDLTSDTLAAIHNRRHELAVCPESRIRDEVMRDLSGGSSRNWLRLAHMSQVLYVIFPLLREIYADNSPWLQRVYELMGRQDAANVREEYLSLAALLWPALEARLQEVKPSRAMWMPLVQDEFYRLLEPYNLARRLVDRLCRAATPLYYMYGIYPQLPSRLSQKTYYKDACMLAEFLGFDISAMANGAAAPARRHRRRKK
jgi:poly(A) polymerase